MTFSFQNLIFCHKKAYLQSGAGFIIVEQLLNRIEQKLGAPFDYFAHPVDSYIYMHDKKYDNNMSWTNIETYGFWQWLYFIGRIITMKTIWAVSSCIFLLIIKYQSEKPKEEKSDFDYFFRNSKF